MNWLFATAFFNSHWLAFSIGEVCVRFLSKFLLFFLLWRRCTQL